MTQDQALEILKSGRNVFLTGSAGTGKTFLLNKFIQYLKEKNKTAGITASTGIAATQLNGRTIHSWSGIRIEKEFNKEVRKNLKDERVRKRIKNAEVLIIDEISMFDDQRLDLLDRVLKETRKSFFPFGGMQMVLCGDFFQLPPVKKDGRLKKDKAGSLFFNEGGREKINFAYNSRAWKSGNIQICYLEKQYRQEDSNFVKILNNIRENKIENQDIGRLAERINKEISFCQKPTKLYTHNEDADTVNNYELAKLPGKEIRYPMTSHGPKNLVKYLKNNCLAKEKLVLKKGAAVMFLKNKFDKGYVNGTLGKVAGFDKNNYPVVRTEKTKREIIAAPESWTVEEGSRVLAGISQIPLKLAWAITIHKSQGMSLDAAEIDLSKCFELGMGYVALSRVRSLDGIKLMGEINDMALKINEFVIEKDREFKKLSGEIAN